MYFARRFFKNVLTEGAVSGIALVLFCMLVPEALAQAPALAVFLCLVLLPLALWMSIAEQSPVLTEAGELSSSNDMAVVADEEDALPFFNPRFFFGRTPMVCVFFYPPRYLVLTKNP